jgi:MOSC domain-containing protein YiiM
MYCLNAEITAIYTSPGHNYFGQPARQPGQHPTHSWQAATVVAGAGLLGDRFFDIRPHFDRQVTFVALEVFEAVAAALGKTALQPLVMRRNIVTRGIPLYALIGETFTLSGANWANPIRFHGSKHCAPCAWMDSAIAPGAMRLLRGRGGLRAQVLDSGVLQVGTLTITTQRPLSGLSLTDAVAPLPLP